MPRTISNEKLKTVYLAMERGTVDADKLSSECGISRATAYRLARAYMYNDSSSSLQSRLLRYKNNNTIGTAKHSPDNTKHLIQSVLGIPVDSDTKILIINELMKKA